MDTRKKIKEWGRRSLKKHYALFVAACLFAAFLGSEFAGSLDFSSAQTREETIDQFERNIQGDFTPAERTVASGVTWGDVLRAIAENDTQAGREMTQQIEEEEIENAETGNPIFGRTRGVLSGVVNKISSGSIIVTIVAAIASITGSKNLGIIILIALGALAAFAFWFLAINVFTVVIRRIFLEGMIYDRVTAQRFTFLMRVKKWLKASWIMFVKYVFYTLWCLTIVGILVKRYAYYLVPYIVAENPDMTARQAITLSRQMMKGHKWECFVFELSFIGWYILGTLTLGLFNIFYTNPYKTASFTKYYALRRQEALENHLPGSERLNDRYLYEKADEALIAKTYGDVISVMNASEEKPEKLTGWRGFLANNFGLLLMRRSQDRLYEQRQAEYVRVHDMIDDVKREAYPVRLYPIPEENRRKLIQSLNYMRHYTVWSLVAIFLGMSFFGWLWEGSLHLIANEPGTYDGISASYSGPGFSGMKFKAIATPDRAAFDQWVAKAKQSPNSMSDMAAFEKLAAPSEYNQVEYFSNVKPDLFADVINKFMAHGKSMDMTQPEGEHSAHEGMEGMDMSHAESAH